MICIKPSVQPRDGEDYTTGTPLKISKAESGWYNSMTYAMNTYCIGQRDMSGSNFVFRFLSHPMTFCGSIIKHDSSIDSTVSSPLVLLAPHTDAYLPMNIGFGGRDQPFLAYCVSHTGEYKCHGLWTRTTAISMTIWWMAMIDGCNA